MLKLLGFQDSFVMQVCWEYKHGLMLLYLFVANFFPQAEVTLKQILLIPFKFIQI